jgi:hypothetical protein
MNATIKNGWPYDKTFNAIGAAVTWQPDRHLSISVEKFAESFGPRITGTRYEALLASLAELQKAAQKVVDDMDVQFGTKEPPFKYQAPFEAIGELRQILSRLYGAR